MTSLAAQAQYSRTTPNLLVFCLLTISTLSFLAFVLAWRRFGFDLTDEAFYWFWMRSPFDFGFSATQFGFVLHPIYQLFNGSVFAVRVWSDLTSFVLAWILAFVLLRKITIDLRPLDEAVLSFSVAPASLLITSFELPPSPSYNTCTFQALILFSIGIALLSGSRGRRAPSRGTEIVGSLLCGAALLVVALVKPPSLVPLFLVAVFCLIFVVKDRIRFLAVGTGTFCILFAVFLLLTRQDPFGFIDGMRGSIAVASLLSQQDGMMTMFRWDSFSMSSRMEYYSLAASIIATGSMLALHKLGAHSIPLIFGGAAVVAVPAILWASVGASFDERYAGVMVLFFPIGIAAFDLLKRQSITFEQVTLAIVFLTMPFAYAFGTNRPYWLNAEGAGLFWVCAGLALLPRRKDLDAVLCLPSIAVLQVIIALLLANAIDHPHRQTQSFRLATESVDIDGKGHKLLVSPDLARYIETLRAVAHKAGFEKDTPIIDLTGRSPGAVFALGGKPPGAPWLLGGYKGSAQFAKAVLSRASCAELARAWLLTEPRGRDEIPASVLDSFGLELDRDYELVGTLPSSATLYGRSFEQEVLKPRSDVELRQKTCEAQRKT